MDIKHRNEAEKLILKNVRKHGSNFVSFKQNYLPAFAYSIGMSQSYEHADFIVFSRP